MHIKNVYGHYKNHLRDIYRQWHNLMKSHPGKGKQCVDLWQRTGRDLTKDFSFLESVNHLSLCRFPLSWLSIRETCIITVRQKRENCGLSSRTRVFDITPQRDIVCDCTCQTRLQGLLYQFMCFSSKCQFLPLNGSELKSLSNPESHWNCHEFSPIYDVPLYSH